MILTNISAPDAGIQLKQENTSAVIDGTDFGNGTLYIAENQVTWMRPTEGFHLQYPNISLHAVSRDLSAYPQEHLYLMIDGKLTAEEPQSDSSEEDDSCATSDVRFVPADNGALEAMFTAMSSCQALHPDPEDSDSEAEDDQFYDGEEGLDELTPEGQVTLQNLENMLQMGQGDGPLSEAIITSASAPQPNGTSENMEDANNGGVDQFEDAADMEQ